MVGSQRLPSNIGVVDEAGSSESVSKKGVITKLFGVILIFVGGLDLMLSWRGGLAISSLYVAFVAAGVFLYALGSIRQGRRASRAES